MNVTVLFVTNNAALYFGLFTKLFYSFVSSFSQLISCKSIDVVYHIIIKFVCQRSRFI